MISCLELYMILILLHISITIIYANAKLSKPSGAYIHIPFCRRRCFYCDFPIKVIGDRPSTQSEISSEYTSLLKRDIESTYIMYCEQSGHSDYPLETVYFGGGTPSLMQIDCVKRVLDSLQSTFTISKNAEITFEMDPGTFDLTKIKQLKDLGINRISLGVQSFDNEILASCGRAHRTSDTERAISDLIGAGIDNYSIDLISSLPNLSLSKWKETLKRVQDSGCTHVSVYDLQIEDNTAFGRWYTPGVFPLPREEEAAEMYTMAVETLTSYGFHHYEISNYAKEGKRSNHNQKYWKCDDVFGFGMSAASLNDGIRFTRPKSLEGYKSWLENRNDFTLSDDDKVDALELIMLSLRTADGLNFKALSQQFGDEYTSKILQTVQPFVKDGFVNYIGNQADIIGIKLSDPKGFLISNDIISSIFAAIN